LQRVEQARCLGMVAQAINGKLDSLSVLRVEHNGVQCKTQAAIEAALFPINKAKVHSSEDNDFLQPPLVDIFRYRGNEAIENQVVLQGTYVPPVLASCHAKFFLSQCTLPDDLPLSDTAISAADHSTTWRKAKEATTGGKSNLTFAMYNAAVAKQTDPLLAQFDGSQRSLSYANSYSFRRWKFGVDDNGAISPVIQSTNQSRVLSSRPRTDVRPKGKDTGSNAEHNVERKR